MEQIAGTPIYIAPEVSKGVPYSEKCDLWSLGIIIYMLLTKKPLFCSSSSDTKIGMNESTFSLDEGILGKFPQAGNLIKKLLKTNPTTRFSAKQALNHDWLKTSFNEISDELKEKKKNFMKSANCQSLNSKTANEIKEFEMRNLFVLLDKEGKGTILLSDLVCWANNTRKTREMERSDACMTYSEFLGFALENKLRINFE